MNDIVLNFLENISLICIIYFNQFYCTEGDPGSLPASKMELFARKVNRWKTIVSRSPMLDVAGLLNLPLMVR